MEARHPLRRSTKLQVLAIGTMLLAACTTSCPARSTAAPSQVKPTMTAKLAPKKCDCTGILCTCPLTVPRGAVSLSLTHEQVDAPKALER